MIGNVVNNFLKLPGVIGLGIFLVQGQVKPYLHFKEQLSREEKQSLTQSIIRMVEYLLKTPEKLEFFEFPIRGYYAYIYKINPNVTLVVLSLKDIPALKLLAAKHLQIALKENIDNTILTFQLLTKDYSKYISISPAITAATSKLNNQAVNVNFEENTIKNFLDAINHISKFTTSYLGLELTRNCWKFTRPNFEGAEEFEISYSAEITFFGQVTECISNLQAYWLKEWTAAFIKQSSKIIKDLPILLELKCLSEQEKRILSFPAINWVKRDSLLSKSWIQ